MYSKYRDYSKKINQMEFLKAIGSGVALASLAAAGYLCSILFLCI